MPIRTGDLVVFKHEPDATVGVVCKVVGKPLQGVDLVYTVEWGEHGPTVPRINIDPIYGTSRKLNFRWTSETADDLKAFHGIDIKTK